MKKRGAAFPQMWIWTGRRLHVARLELKYRSWEDEDVKITCS